MDIVIVVGEVGNTHTVAEIDTGHRFLRSPSSDHEPLENHLLGITKTGLLLATPRWNIQEENPNHSLSFDFFEFNVDSAHPHFRAFTIDMPQANIGYERYGEVEGSPEIELSPQGDRLAWLLYRQRTFPPEWLTQWLPWKTPTHHYAELRVTNLDGTGEKIIGTIEFNRKLVLVPTKQGDVLWQSV